MATRPVTSWQIDGGKVEAVTDFILSGSKVTVDSDCGHEIRRYFLLGKKTMTNLWVCVCSVTSVMSNSLQPHGL